MITGASHAGLNFGPRATGLRVDFCHARIQMRAGGAAAPSLAGGAGAGGSSRAQQRRAQREAALDRAQRAGQLDEVRGPRQGGACTARLYKGPNGTRRSRTGDGNARATPRAERCSRRCDRRPAARNARSSAARWCAAGCTVLCIRSSQKRAFSVAISVRLYPIIRVATLLVQCTRVPVWVNVGFNKLTSGQKKISLFFSRNLGGGASK